MNIVVLGAGKVGFNVAKELSFSENDISIVDISKSALEYVSEKLDIKPVFGHASDITVLKEAGIEEADVVIAVTSSDEVNITACQIADFMFNINKKIARIGRKSYFNANSLFEKGKFSIDFAISPEFETVKMVKRIISVPGAIDVVSCIKNKLRIIGVVCKSGAPIIGVPMKYIQSIDPKSIIALLMIKRGENCIISNTRDVVRAGDEVYFVCSVNNIQEAMALFGYSVENKSNVIFIGGNTICEDVISSVNSKDVSIKVIESDLLRAEKLSETLNDVEVLNGDPLNTELLETSGIRDAEVVISMTNDDKINILSSLLSKKLGAKRVTTLLNDASYTDILCSLGINSILDSRMATVSKTLHYIHEENLENILSFEDMNIKIFAVTVTNSSYAVGVLTDNILIKDEVYIPAIIRGEQLFMLPQNMLLIAGDKVLFIARKNAIEKILTIFQEKPKYLL